MAGSIGSMEHLDQSIAKLNVQQFMELIRDTVRMVTDERFDIIEARLYGIDERMEDSLDLIKPQIQTTSQLLSRHEEQLVKLVA